MLDRKTKNIDASIELLEDKKNSVKYWAIFALSFGAFYMVMGFIISFSSNSGIAMLIMSAVVIFLGCYLGTDMDNYTVLIQAKRMMETQQVHTDLLDEMLNSMDSLEKNVNKKAGKKK